MCRLGFGGPRSRTHHTLSVNGTCAASKLPRQAVKLEDGGEVLFYDGQSLFSKVVRFSANTQYKKKNYYLYGTDKRETHLRPVTAIQKFTLRRGRLMLAR